MNGDDSVVRISHSMADAYNACEKRYEYAHVENLQPKEQAKQLARGIYGHKVMAAFFQAIKDGEDAQMAEAFAVSEAYKDTTYFPEVCPQIFYWIRTIWPTKDWEILEVEKTYFLPLGEGEEYPFTVDLLVRTGGKLVIIDHKFSADEYSDDLLDVFPQIPIYIGALRALKINVAYGIYNFLRTRNMKDTAKQLVMIPVRPSVARIKNSFRHQVETSIRIQMHTGPYLRTFNNNCGYCPFIKLCRLEVNGEDSTEMKRIAYEPNTYGYEDERIVDL